MNDRPSDKPNDEPRGLGCTAVVIASDTLRVCGACGGYGWIPFTVKKGRGAISVRFRDCKRCAGKPAADKQ